MKNFLKIIVLAAVFCFVASCENSIGKKTIDENDGDKTDTEIPDDDADHGDTEIPDNPDTEIPDDPDTDLPDTATDDDEDIVDTEIPAVYETPYGSLTLNFNDVIGAEGEPHFSNDVFATGAYGNGTASIMPEYVDKIETVAVVENDNIYIQQTPIYADGTFGNPVVEFFLPVDQATIGFHDINYNVPASLIVSEMDWNTRTAVCYHAFGEGQIEVSEANVNDMFKVITFSGNVTLYNPKNYKWEDVTAAFLEKFPETNLICDPVD
ncbi:hypothetical protein J5681_08995 [bacterium]|nr:hypothetical protein [bacterium]